MRNRVNQMVAAKVLRVIGVADPVALGNEGYALVAMRLSAEADPRLVSARFEACDEVTFVLFAAGQFDLVVEVICETHRDLRDFLLEHCYGQAEIASVLDGIAQIESRLDEAVTAAEEELAEIAHQRSLRQALSDARKRASDNATRAMELTQEATNALEQAKTSVGETDPETHNVLARAAEIIDIAMFQAGEAQQAAQHHHPACPLPRNGCLAAARDHRHSWCQPHLWLPLPVQATE